MRVAERERERERSTPLCAFRANCAFVASLSVEVFQQVAHIASGNQKVRGTNSLKGNAAVCKSPLKVWKLRAVHELRVALSNNEPSCRRCVKAKAVHH